MKRDEILKAAITAVRERGQSYGEPEDNFGRIAVLWNGWMKIRKGGELRALDGEPFAAVIRCTAEPAKVDKRTRSKWSRVLRYALRYKSHSEPLDQFIKRKGRINGCADRFTRCLERAAA